MAVKMSRRNILKSVKRTTVKFSVLLSVQLQLYDFMILYKLFEIRRKNMLLIYLTNRIVVFNPRMKKNSYHMDDKQVSPRCKNFIPPVGKWNEISPRGEVLHIVNS